MTEPTQEASPQTSETQIQAPAVQRTGSVVTRTPDGTCESTVTVTVQVTTTLGPPASPTFTKMSPDEGSTNPGPGSKGSGLGVERNPVAALKSSDDDNTNPGSETKAGLGVERKT